MSALSTGNGGNEWQQETSPCWDGMLGKIHWPMLCSHGPVVIIEGVFTLFWHLSLRHNTPPISILGYPHPSCLAPWQTCSQAQKTQMSRHSQQKPPTRLLRLPRRTIFTGRIQKWPRHTNNDNTPKKTSYRNMLTMNSSNRPFHLFPSLSHQYASMQMHRVAPISAVQQRTTGSLILSLTLRD